MLRASIIATIGMVLIGSSAFAETATGSVRAGNTLYQEGNYEEALKKYKAAQVESPKDERIMFNLGAVQYKLGQYEEALAEHLRSAQAEDPGIGAQSHYNAGNALYRAGRLENAIEQYLQALEINPQDEDAKYNLEFVRREMERRKQQQQQRQQEQQQKQDQKKDESQQKEKQDKQKSEDQKEDTQQPDPQQEKKEQEGEQQQETAPETPPEEQQAGQPESPEERQGQQPSQEQSMDEKNMERWLDAVEAETAENMKEFLRKQQPTGETRKQKDW